jgi:branched-chain amino acid transport system substrate-binding protein
VRRAAALALVGGLALAGCGGGNDGPTLRPGTLRVGAVPGPTAWDAEVLNGVRAGVRELNRRGGIDGDVRVTLAVGDAPKLAAAGVRVLVLPCDTRSQAASAASVRRRRGLVLEPCNTGLWRRFPAVWPISVAPADEARVLVDYAHDEQYRRVGVVGEGRMGRAVRAAASRAGLELVGPRSKQADAVIVALAAPYAQAAVADLRARRPDVPVLATHGLDDRSVNRGAGDSFDGVVYTTFGYPEPGSALDELYERYRALTGHRPASSVSALGYDAVRVLEFAAVEAASTRPNAIAAAMPGLHASGATGSIEYPERGGRNPKVSVALVRISHGRPTLVDRVGV